MDLLLGCGRALVAEVDGAAEGACLVGAGGG